MSLLSGLPFIGKAIEKKYTPHDVKITINGVELKGMDSEGMSFDNEWTNYGGIENLPKGKLTLWKGETLNKPIDKEQLLKDINDNKINDWHQKAGKITLKYVLRETKKLQDSAILR